MSKSANLVDQFDALAVLTRRKPEVERLAGLLQGLSKHNSSDLEKLAGLAVTVGKSQPAALREMLGGSEREQIVALKAVQGLGDGADAELVQAATSAALKSSESPTPELPGAAIVFLENCRDGGHALLEMATKSAAPLRLKALSALGRFVSGRGAAGGVFCDPLPTRFNLHCIVVDPNPRPDSVVFDGPADSGISQLPSSGYWDFLGPTTRLYFTPELTTPPYPPGGVYQVDYRGLNFAFRKPHPDAQARQIRVRPEITVSAGNFSQVNWVYEDLQGRSIPTPTAFTSLTLRLESDTGQLFNEDNLPLEPRSKRLPSAIAWSTLRNVESNSRRTRKVAFLWEVLV